jgi:hypothetical protein
LSNQSIGTKQQQLIRVRLLSCIQEAAGAHHDAAVVAVTMMCCDQAHQDLASSSWAERGSL